MRSRIPLALMSAFALVLTGAAPASAAFPGRNGRLVYQQETVAGDHTQTDLWTIEPGGGTPRRLTATPALNEFGPAWNAAGTRIAFWRTPAPFGPGTVWTMDADGRHQRRLTKGRDARDPAWNRAGDRIVFTDASAGRFDLWTMRPDGSRLRRLTSGAALDFEAAWSPDGGRIAFTRGSETGDPGDLWVLRLATGKLTRVTRTADYDHQVAWSPDGRRLVFERDTATRSSIWTVGADGARPTRLTSGNHFDVGPAWSPDGRRITFGSDRGAVLQDLWTMTATGTELQRVRATPTASDSFPDWQPRRR